MLSINCLVEVTIRGAVDKKTGMVMNITELKDHMDQAIMKPLDHKNLDKDVDFFKLQVIFEKSFFGFLEQCKCFWKKTKALSNCSD